LTDYPADPGCSSATDGDEYNAPPQMSLINSNNMIANLLISSEIDNVGDGLIDIHDPDCTPCTEIKFRLSKK
jgi:hypothetical protein